MLILLTRAMSNSSIKLWGNFFKGNTGLVGGGGLAISTITLSNLYPINNMISILNTSFVNNLGLYGGGISIDGSSVSKIEQFNSFNCINCIFEENSAQIVAAVSVASTDKGSQFITDTCFTDSKFKNNIIVIKFVSGSLNGNQNGACYITEVQVTFAGTTNFTGNNGTALLTCIICGMQSLHALLCIIFILIPPPTILSLETILFSMDFFANTPLNWYYNRL